MYFSSDFALTAPKEAPTARATEKSNKKCQRVLFLVSAVVVSTQLPVLWFELLLPLGQGKPEPRQNQ